MMTYDFSGQDLREADFSEADLTGAVFVNADLREAILVGAVFVNADLREAILAGADLAGADLAGADLAGADLSGADLHATTLTRANFSGANLHEADLSWANLNGADLTGADLTGVTLAGADLTDAVMVRVVGLAAWDEQCALLERIRDAVVAEPDALDMRHWHSPCGTTHSLAGWSQYLTGVEGDAAVVGSGLIPVAATVFLDDTTSVRRWLEDRAWVSQACLWVEQDAA